MTTLATILTALLLGLACEQQPVRVIDMERDRAAASPPSSPDYITIEVEEDDDWKLLALCTEWEGMPESRRCWDFPK